MSSTVPANKLSRRTFVKAASCAAAALGMAALTGCGESNGGSADGSNSTVYVFNAGEYIDESVIQQFTDETGIRVVYDTFETLEAMYPIIEQGYNPTKMDEVPEEWSWDILWDPKYENEILMQKSVRDAFAVALRKLGYSINTTDPDEIAEARDLLIEQKPLVQAYVIDQVRDKMIGGEATLGVIYSGEYMFCKEQNPDLEYVVPVEGSNVWLDCWVVPANAESKENGEKWINFL